MKTKNKLFIAKIIYNLISFIFKKKRRIVKRKEIFWNLDLFEAIDLHVFIFGNFEPEIKNTAKKLNMDHHKVILDIGANFGVQSLQFAKEFNKSKIYSVEPTDYAFSKMLINFELNKKKFENLFPCQLFIGIEDQKLPNSIYSSWNLEFEEKKHKKHLGSERTTNMASLMTLDNFIISKNIKKIDFIKLDVDGYEYYVIKSGFQFLKKNKPPIFMELAPYLYKEYGYSVENLIDLILSLDYKFYNINNVEDIENIYKKIDSIPDGSSENILLM